MDSKELVDRATRGDRDAFGELVSRHMRDLLAYVRLRAGPIVLDRESASDIAHSVCREILERLPELRYGGEAGFRRWLFETALRKIADRHAHWKAAKRDIRRESPAPSSEEYAAAATIARFLTPSEEACADESARDIEAAYRTLDERQREAIALSRIVGSSHEEIAAQMNLANAAAARKLLHGALAELSATVVTMRRRRLDAV